MRPLSTTYGWREVLVWLFITPLSTLRRVAVTVCLPPVRSITAYRPPAARSHLCCITYASVVFRCLRTPRYYFIMVQGHMSYSHHPHIFPSIFCASCGRVGGRPVKNWFFSSTLPGLWRWSPNSSLRIHLYSPELHFITLMMRPINSFDLLITGLVQEIQLRTTYLADKCMR